jgi:hypothetical protein
VESHVDSYIVRVYRRNHVEFGEEVAGLVEEVGTDQKKSFRSFSGLITTIREVVGKGTPGKGDVVDLRRDMKLAINK